MRLPERYLPMHPSQLSGGLKQRVAIARAFAGDPRIVVCDEPTSALDVSVQAAILNLLTDLQHRKQVAYLFISHDLGVVRYLADRIVVLYLGRIMEFGPADEVFAGPHHPYTEALLSAVPDLDDLDRLRIRLDGEIPSAADPPTGCPFHTRCPRKIGEICETTEPELIEEEAGTGSAATSRARSCAGCRRSTAAPAARATAACKPRRLRPRQADILSRRDDETSVAEPIADPRPAIEMRASVLREPAGPLRSRRSCSRRLDAGRSWSASPPPASATPTCTSPTAGWAAGAGRSRWGTRARAWSRRSART